MNNTNKLNVKNWDRSIAFLLIEGKVYESEVNHQDCFLYYCRDIGHELKRLLDDEEAYDEMLDDLVERTYKMKTSHDAYGFDVFERHLGQQVHGQQVLVAHDAETLTDNKDWAKKWASDNNAKLGYFVDRYDVQLIA